MKDSQNVNVNVTAIIRKHNVGEECERVASRSEDEI